MFQFLRPLLLISTQFLKKTFHFKKISETLRNYVIGPPKFAIGYVTNIFVILEALVSSDKDSVSTSSDTIDPKLLVSFVSSDTRLCQMH